FRLSDELTDREVTYRDLLSHRTGMPRHDMLWAGRDIGSEELIRRWAEANPSTPFRSTWGYSNVPVTTAGFVGGRVDRPERGERDPQPHPRTARHDLVQHEFEERNRRGEPRDAALLRVRPVGSAGGVGRDRSRRRRRLHQQHGPRHGAVAPLPTGRRNSQRQ